MTSRKTIQILSRSGVRLQISTQGRGAPQIGPEQPKTKSNYAQRRDGSACLANPAADGSSAFSNPRVAGLNPAGGVPYRAQSFSALKGRSPNTTLGGGSIHCFSGLPFTPKGGQVTLDELEPARGACAHFALGAISGCPSDTQALSTRGKDRLTKGPVSSWSFTADAHSFRKARFLRTGSRMDGANCRC
jgi:hypothetical protein